MLTRLLLSVEPATEDIMLFGQAPCSAGRMKHRRVNYLALLGPATNGQCDITAPYVPRKQEQLLRMLRDRRSMTPREIWDGLGVTRQGAIKLL